jgi:hypothetical protein
MIGGMRPRYGRCSRDPLLVLYEGHRCKRTIRSRQNETRCPIGSQLTAASWLSRGWIDFLKSWQPGESKMSVTKELSDLST